MWWSDGDMHGTGTRKWRTASRCLTNMARWGRLSGAIGRGARVHLWGEANGCGAVVRMGAGRIETDGVFQASHTDMNKMRMLTEDGSEGARGKLPSSRTSSMF